MPSTLRSCPPSDRYYYEERTTHTRNPDTILVRKRYTSMSADAVATLIAQKDTESLNKLAQARRLEGTDIARITVDTEGVGLCLISPKKIQATESKPIKLWEYTGEVKPVHNEHQFNPPTGTEIWMRIYRWRTDIPTNTNRSTTRWSLNTSNPRKWTKNLIAILCWMIIQRRHICYAHTNHPPK